MKKYFLHDGLNQYGPFDLAELESKIITPQTMIWYESLPDWKPAAEIDELKPLLNSKIPASQITSPPIVASKGEDWTKKSYYYADDHGQQGPFTLEQLKSRPIKADTSVWYDPLPEWTTADKVPGLKDLVGSGHQVSITSTTTVIEQKEVSTERLYYYMANGVQQGPFTLEQLKGKSIAATTSVWYDPLPQWTTADKVAELKDIITVQPASTQRMYYYMANGTQQGPFTLEQLKEKSINASTSLWYDPLPQWTTAGQVHELKDIISAPQPMNTQRLYYYMANGVQQGPFTLEQLKGKSINASTSVWYDPLSQWTTAGQVPELRDIISAQPVSSTPAAPQPMVNQRLYYYMYNNSQQGPFTSEQLKGRGIIASTSVWYDPLPQWTTAGQVAELKDIINAAQPMNAQRLYYYMNNGVQQGPFTLDQLRGRGIVAGTQVWYDPLPQWTTAGQVPELAGI